jgi:hypothetical protein
MRAGRLITTNARDAERRCDCGHPEYVHRERRLDDPAYRPLLFVCGMCPCEIAARGAA